MKLIQCSEQCGDFILNNWTECKHCSRRQSATQSQASKRWYTSGRFNKSR